MKMKLKNNIHSGKPGEDILLFGFPGVVGDDGVAILEVPDEFAPFELAVGRLSSADDIINNNDKIKAPKELKKEAKKE